MWHYNLSARTRDLPQPSDRTLALHSLGHGMAESRPHTALRPAGASHPIPSRRSGGGYQQSGLGVAPKRVLQDARQLRVAERHVPHLHSLTRPLTTTQTPPMRMGRVRHGSSVAQGSERWSFADGISTCNVQHTTHRVQRTTRRATVPHATYTVATCSIIRCTVPRATTAGEHRQQAAGSRHSGKASADLVLRQRLDAVPEGRQRQVDALRLLEPLPRRARLAHLLRPCATGRSACAAMRACVT